jgi:UPF0042 nucleotide-binding protein apar_0926
MIDVRFLPNPYYDPELRPLTGLDEPVAQFVLTHGTTKKFLKSWFELLDVVMPGYVQEGKSLLSIAVGCTGGQHRSVAIARATAEHLTSQGYRVTLFHRDLDAAKKKSQQAE